MPHIWYNPLNMLDGSGVKALLAPWVAKTKKYFSEIGRPGYPGGIHFGPLVIVLDDAHVHFAAADGEGAVLGAGLDFLAQVYDVSVVVMTCSSKYVVSYVFKYI